MAIIGYKRVGWSRDETKKKYELLIQFDTEEERDSFEKIIDRIQELIGWSKL